MGIIFDRILLVCAGIASVFALGIMLASGFQVIARYIFNLGVTWLTEIINFMLIYLVFLGAPWLLKEKGHVAIDLIYVRQNEITRRVLDIIVSAVGALSCSIMVLFSALKTIDNFAGGVIVSSTFQVPRGFFLCILPVGFLLLSIEFVRQLYKAIFRPRSQETEPTEIEYI